MRDFDQDDRTLPVVPFCPWRCPRCGDAKPFTYGRQGRKRYHKCKECGTRYLSQQLTADELTDWRPPPSNDFGQQG